MDMAEHAHVIDVSRYYPAQGKRQELLTAMKQLAEKATASKGCFGAQACESDHDRDALIAVSRWSSQADLDGFAGAPDFVHDRERLTSLLAKPAQREHLRPV
jgi:quinol monooxygenase YgiN